jgi:three-Cys-motif partner protein
MSRIELNRQQNPACIKGCNKEERAKKAENDVCSLVKSINDNLSVRCVGQWGEEKIFLLHQYFGIFAGGMKNKWPLNYIEICSGPGRCINRQEGCEFDGTAIAIMNHKQFQHVNKAIFYDYDENVINTLNQRISNMHLSHKAIAKFGDYNHPDTICADLKSLDDNSLNLIFIDPTDCSVPFSLIKGISNTLGKVDLIINVATMTDFNRNIQMAFDDPKRAEKYVRFLDDDNFFASDGNRILCGKKDYTRLRKQFRESYMNSLKRVGFNYFDYTPINGFYDILFATSNPKGIEFWKKATKIIDSSGQRTLDFGL